MDSLTSNHVSSAQPALEIISDFCVNPAGHFQEHGFDNSEVLSQHAQNSVFSHRVSTGSFTEIVLLSFETET